MALNIGNLLGNIATSLANSILEQRLVVPSADLPAVVEAANEKLALEAPGEAAITSAQAKALDEALIDYTAGRVAHAVQTHKV